MQLATEEKGKKEALEKLERRKEANMSIVQKNNSMLHAGSPMYYYCRSCNHEMVLSETHTCAAPTLCVECVELKIKDWIK